MARPTRSSRDGEFVPLEEERYLLGCRGVAGIDESGRGPLAGPVVAAAVILPRGFVERGIRDSKLLSARQREGLARVIKAGAVSWGLGVSPVDEIDRINILKATLKAMALACRALAPAADHLLIDGNQTIPAVLLGGMRELEESPGSQTAVIHGDRLCQSIAAASILAKVARDEMMLELDAIYPHYGFASHKGYGSAAHLAALRRHGPSPVHRRSFAPVRELLAGA